MGGSSYPGGGGGTQNPNDCGGIFEFFIIIKGDTDLLFFDFEVNQEVKVELVKEKLPKLEVTRLHDDMYIGLVPPRYSMLINCIEQGWEYYGKIVKIEGIEVDPKIYIRIKGEK